MSQLDKYNGECTVAHRQRLVWKLSNRTLRHLRPTDKLRATLPTIKETSNLQRMRSVRVSSPFRRLGNDVMILKIFSPKKLTKKMAFFIRNEAKLCKKLS
jgi:hypothetical protein